MFTFQLGQVVKVKATGETVVVKGRAEWSRHQQPYCCWSDNARPDRVAWYWENELEAV